MAETTDTVIVGAGAAGLFLAARLAEAGERGDCLGGGSGTIHSRSD